MVKKGRAAEQRVECSLAGDVNCGDWSNSESNAFESQSFYLWCGLLPVLLQLYPEGKLSPQD